MVTIEGEFGGEGVKQLVKAVTIKGEFGGEGVYLGFQSQIFGREGIPEKL